MKNLVTMLSESLASDIKAAWQKKFKMALKAADVFSERLFDDIQDDIVHSKVENGLYIEAVGLNFDMGMYWDEENQYYHFVAGDLMKDDDDEFIGIDVPLGYADNNNINIFRTEYGVDGIVKAKDKDKTKFYELVSIREDYFADRAHNLAADLLNNYKKIKAELKKALK